MEGWVGKVGWWVDGSEDGCMYRRVGGWMY